MNKRIKNLIHPRFLEKVEMQTVHNRVLNVIGNIDINRDIRHDYGYFTPTLIETVATCDLPQNLKDQTARIKVLWFDRPSPKYGLLKLDIEGVGSAYAFFSKKVINTKRYMSDICSLFWKNKKYVMVNVDLVDATSKIPYIVTEMWCIGDRNKDFSTPKDNLKDWNKVVPSMGCDHTSLNFRAYEEVVEKRFQESIKAEEHREEQRLKQRLEHVSKPKEIVQTTWKPAIKGVVCKVERVIGANYAAAFNHQLINHESKRYFVLFDLMDLYIDGKPSKDTAVGKTLKDFVTVGCKVRLNAVFCDVENSWNLNYIATGVVVGSNESVPRLPADAPCPDSVNKLMEAKIANFKLVASKITKKPPPPDTQPMPPPRENKISPSQSPSDNQFAPKPSNYKDNRLPYQNKYKDNRKGQNRNFDKPTSESRHNSHNVNEQNLAKRAEIIRQKPEVYKELQLMEINRDGVYIYDCKACGIQGMSIDDAEDHINSESHKESKLKRELMQSNKAASEGTSGSRAKQHFLDRSDAEEAIFINANQGITVEKTHTGLKLFICKACNSNKMSFSSAKKHVTSMAHKKRVTIDQSAIDHELTYMRKRIRSGVVYCCQPCGLQTESLLSTKEHVKDKTHIAKCEAYCHPCKLFFHDKKSLGDHKFSISHKKKIKNFEQELAKPFVKPVAKPASKPAEAVPQPAATPSAESEQNELSCEFCKFEAKDRREMKEHESTPSHQRRKFLKTKELPKEGIQAFVAAGERCDSITELSYVREGKDIQEEADREKLLRTSQEIKDKQERLINKIFDSGIFIQQADKTKVKCITCSIMLTGKEKQLTRQLLLHFLGDKHKNKLIGEVKAEESTGVDRNESDRRREEERAAAEAEDNEPENDDEGTNAGPSDAPPAGQSQIQPEPVKQLQAPHESATDEEIILYLREQENVCIMMSDQLFSCLACYTGLKHLRQFYKHFMSEEHKKEITPTREWRQYVDLVDIFEHGEGLFKCLPCNTSPLSRQELETHLKTAQHMYSNVDEVKDYKITQLLPIELPVCQADASCNLCLASDLDLKIHERYKHKKVYDLTSDQIENLTTLSQSRNVDRQKMMNNVRGRILEILPDSNIGIIQLPQHENQYINVLFDLSAVVMPEKQSTLVESVRVGDPVLVNCVEMDLDPKNVGYSANINYYASCVTIGDEDEHSGMPRSYESLLLEKSDTITEACKLSLAALKVQLELCADGRPTPLFHTFPDKLENEVCFVVMKNQSCLLLKSLSTNCYAIQVLESMLITANSLETSSETFEVGQTVIVNGLLMDPALPTQYLVTGCWIMNERPAIAREQLALNAVVMYQSLVKSFCMEPEIFPLLDLSNVVVPEQFGTIGFDDIAADSTLTDDLADNSMSVDAPSQNNDDLADEGPIPFKRIKLGF